MTLSINPPLIICTKQERKGDREEREIRSITVIPVSWQVEEAAVLLACQPTRGSVMWTVVPWEPGGRQRPLDN